MKTSANSTSEGLLIAPAVLALALVLIGLTLEGCSTRFTPSKKSGTISLSNGIGTATVSSDARCVCTDTTAANSVQCTVMTTTLTAIGTGTDVIAYYCF